MTATPTVPTSSYDRVGTVVEQRAGEMQSRALMGVPSAIAALARLRRGAGKPPGEVLDILEFTVSDAFFTDRSDSDPSIDEYAAHVALTLFALHQQSQSTPMHRRGVGLGTALRRLHDGPDPVPDPVQRRFRVLGTADGIGELVHHLRGAVQLLRTKDLPLDYGLLADQLVSWQWSGGPSRVRLRWGREFYRTSRPAPATP